MHDLAEIPPSVAELLSELKSELESSGLPPSAAIPPMTRDGSFACDLRELAGYPVRICTEYSHSAGGWIITVDAILQCPPVPA